MNQGSCHCGAIRLELQQAPERLVSCNCSVCRRYRALWFHLLPEKVRISGETVTYSRSPNKLAFHCCPACHCLTHWSPLIEQPGDPWMAVNMAMFDPALVADLPRRKFDGAETWKFID